MIEQLAQELSELVAQRNVLLGQLLKERSRRELAQQDARGFMQERDAAWARERRLNQIIEAGRQG